MSQGDKETALGLPNSPLCNRTETLVPESQVGFIDFIIVPSMNLLGDMFDALLLVQNEEATSTGTKPVRLDSLVINFLNSVLNSPFSPEICTLDCLHQVSFAFF